MEHGYLGTRAYASHAHTKADGYNDNIYGDARYKGKKGRIGSIFIFFGCPKLLACLPACLLAYLPACLFARSLVRSHRPSAFHLVSKNWRSVIAILQQAPRLFLAFLLLICPRTHSSSSKAPPLAG